MSDLLKIWLPKTLLFLSTIGLTAALLSLAFLGRKTNFAWLIFFFPFVWLLWILAVFFVQNKTQIPTEMKAAWAINACAILVLVGSFAVSVKIPTNRVFVEIGDILANSFLPVVFPVGIIPGIGIEAIDKIMGKGHFWKIIHGHGFVAFTIFEWSCDSIAALVQSCLMVGIIRRYRRSGLRGLFSSCGGKG